MESDQRLLQFDCIVTIDMLSVPKPLRGGDTDGGRNLSSKATTSFNGIHTTQGLHRVYGQPLVGVDHVTTTSREECLHVVSAGRYPERTENDGLPRFGTNGGLVS